jgi:tRNA (guanine6-N2)-methyltransferase
MRYFILTTRGLEDLVAAEARALFPADQRVEMAYRRVLLDAPAEAAHALLGLRLADDLFALAATWQGIGKSRKTVEQLSELAATADLGPALALCDELREIARPVQFAVSASFVGRRNYTSPQMKLAIAAGVESRHGWAYRDEESLDALSLRLFIEHELALFGVRLAAQPLHRRSYRAESVPGSLRPPVAAALAQLAGAAPGLTLLDPLCGAGTILVEAALMGAAAIGGDNSADALAIARSNSLDAAASVELRQWDARALPLAEASVDAVASNLPFGRQVLADTDLGPLYGAVLGEIARVLRPGGRAALLTGAPEALPAHPALQLIEQHEISLHGQNPKIMIFQRS